MSFRTGRVSFVRFSVEGDAPTSVDETALGILKEFSFTEQELGMPEEVEAGFVTGEHIFDSEFSYDKNGFGDLLLFALRIDTNKPPSEIKNAYRHMQEKAIIAQSDNPTGFASRREKREAKEAADSQLREDMTAGKFRRSKMVPVLWDLKAKTIYFGAAGQNAADQLMTKMSDAFSVSLMPLSAGRLVGETMRHRGEGRDYEDLHPTPFTPAPSGASNTEDAVPRDPAIPFVPWAQQGIDAKDFLGNELFIWLWWVTETQEGMVTIAKPDDHRSDEIAITIDKALDMECAWGIQGKQMLRADGASRMIEAADGLASGKWPRKFQLILADIADGSQWELTWQADRMMISSAKLPELEEVNTQREVVEQRLAATRKLGQITDGLMVAFMQTRNTTAWSEMSNQIRQWIRKRHPSRKAEAASVGG